MVNGGNRFNDSSTCNQRPVYAIPQDQNQRWEHFLEALHDLFALVFLQIGEGRVQHDNAEQGAGDVKIALTRVEIIGEECQQTAADQQNCEEVLGLQQELDDLGRLFTYPQLVGPEVPEPDTRLLLAQTIRAGLKGQVKVSQRLSMGIVRGQIRGGVIAACDDFILRSDNDNLLLVIPCGIRLSEPVWQGHVRV
jgi:hypothetical protein